MRGDYSRLRFRPTDHYSSVRLQQGRVHLDADFNEQVDIEAHRDAMTALDVIGPEGVPYESGGFAIAPGAVLRGVGGHPSTNEAWAVGEVGTLVHSSDGGRTWGAPVAPPSGAVELNAVHVRSSAEVWAAGADGTVLRFHAEGWTTENPPIQTPTLHGVHFVTADDGWVVGDAAAIRRRTSGGWVAQTAQEVTGALRAVAFADEQRGVAVGDGGAIIWTNDAGETWVRQAVPAGTGDLLGVAIDASSGGELAWAVGEGGTILFTDDGGVNWARRDTPADVTAALHGVAFADAQTGIVVGDDATLLSTFDAGASWEREDPPQGVVANLRSVSHAPQPIAVGDGVALVRESGEVTGWFAATLDAASRSLTISAGDGYAGGIRAVNERTVTVTTQPGAPGVGLPSGGGAADYGVYLHVAQHHVTAVEHDELREIALGGPDTTTRTRTVWRVGFTDALSEPTCEAARVAMPGASGGGRLRARSVPGEEAETPCAVPPGGGYRRLENQLYRVEILEAGQLEGDIDLAGPRFEDRADRRNLDALEIDGNGAGRFTWSRENGSVLAPLVAIDADSKALTFGGPDRDEALSFSAGDLVEVSDEGRALRGERGIVLEINAVRGKVMEVGDFPPHPQGRPWGMEDFPRRATVRRWEGAATVIPGSWIALEDGVEVQFAGSAFAPGDYWTIPARTLRGDVEWPRSGGTPLFEEGASSDVRRMLLAVASRSADGTWTTIDCRRRFAPLTGLVHAFYVGGDGQEAMPDLTQPAQLTQLDRPLEVGVSNWRWPVLGAAVRFNRIAGAGAIDVAGGTLLEVRAADADLVVATDAAGIAACTWSIDATGDDHVVEATLLDEHGVAMQTPIRFSANRSVASRVAYDPGACSGLSGATDVQTAIERLSQARRLHHISGTGIEAREGETIQLRAGISSACDATESGNVAFEVTMGSGIVEPSTASAGDDGTVAASFTLGAPEPESGLVSWEVTARLLSAAGEPAATPPVVFAIGRARGGGGGSCTVDVRPGDDLAAAVAEVPGSGGELCLAAGVYELDAAVLVSNRHSIVITGRGPSTVLRATASADALRFESCEYVTVRDLRAEGAVPEGPDGDLNGALTFVDCAQVRVVDCQLASAPAFAREHACVAVRSIEGGVGTRVEIERNLLEAAAWQVGAVVVGAECATLAHNEIQLHGGADPRRQPLRTLAGELQRSVLHAQVKQSRTSVTFDFPGTDATITLRRDSPLVALVKAFQARFQPREPVDLRAELRRWLEGSARQDPDPEVAGAFERLLGDVAAVGQGIVVGGRRAETVRIFDNVVEDAIQGIHIGISDARTGERERAGDVIVSRNVVRCRIPAGWRRERHAVLVANARSVSIVDTTASLARSGERGDTNDTAVTGIVVRGNIGPYLKVRQSHLQAAFTHGVRVEPAPDTVPSVRMWLVAETMLDNLEGQAVVAPEAEQERNYPVRPQ